jgi:ribosomal protein S27E
MFESHGERDLVSQRSSQEQEAPPVMPYVTCPSCHVSAYSAARWSTREACPRCGATLAAPQRPAYERLDGYRAETGRVSAFTKSSSWPVVQHSNASQ